MGITHSTTLCGTLTRRNTMRYCEKCGMLDPYIGHPCLSFDAFRGPGTGLPLMARTDPFMREWRARYPMPGTIERNMCGQITRIH